MRPFTPFCLSALLILAACSETQPVLESANAPPLTLELLGLERCKTETLRIFEASPSDCSFSLTAISAEYDPDDQFVLEIPVVFHVIQSTSGEGNISERLLRSQIAVLNQDYQAFAYAPGADGFNGAIQFRLESIERYTNNSWFNDGGGYKSQIGWDQDRYLNIYTNSASGALGYASLPMSSAGSSSDGVTLLWSAVGNGSPAAPYDMGRTATHEVGHYLGLFHTFDDGCGSAANPYTTGDLIADTVAENQPHYNCNAGASPCGGGNLPIDNYMNYSVDSCMDHFTTEQANRMRCALINYRPDLYTVKPVNEAPSANFTYTIERLEVTFSATASDPDGTVTMYEWDFGDGRSSDDSNPTHLYNSGGEFTVRLLALDDVGQPAEVVKQIAINGPPNAFFQYVTEGLHVTFDDQSTDPGGQVAAWSWDFGDGNTSPAEDPVHRYKKSGTYTVTLTVADDQGELDVMSTDLTVEGGKGDDDGPAGCACTVSESPIPRDAAAGLVWLGLVGAALVLRRRFRRA